MNFVKWLNGRASKRGIRRSEVRSSWGLRKKANLRLFSFKEREKQSERQRERQEGKEISGEHDSISENLRIFNCLIA